ncbi:hypothetical protein [Comamonas guangdongensis]|uniref:DUF2946 domain-containing protein n=1 Tax=Comamonas guangdongensis TaxID=510515 RepID=A0ABV3ZX41_9BURK
MLSQQHSPRQPSQTPPAHAAGRASLRGAGLTRWLLGLLVWAMVLGPTLGQMHRAVHAAAASQASVAVQHGVTHAGFATQAADGADCADGCASNSWVHALFAGHGPAACQLLDQASHGYAGPPAMLAFVGVAPESALPRPFVAAPRAVALAAPFDARAPPLHSSRA